MRRADQDPAALSLLLYVSTWYQGAHGWCPQYYVQRRTGSGQATAAEVRQGCMGLFSACELAAAHLLAVPEHTAALLTSADNYNSPLFDRWRFSPHSLLGGGACALLLTRKRGFARLGSINSVTLPQYEEWHRGAAPLFPPEASLGTKVDLGRVKRQDPPGGGPGHVRELQGRLRQLVRGAGTGTRCGPAWTAHAVRILHRPRWAEVEDVR